MIDRSPTHDSIARRAFELFETRGRAHEHDLEDWTQAESEFNAADAERRVLKEQLAQAHKMEAIGRLAGGVAHDFNNLLNVIIGYSELLLLRMHEEDLRSVVENIRKAASTAASLTGQLLAFSRREVLAPRVLDLNRVVSDIARMLPRLIGENIAVETVLSPELGRVALGAAVYVQYAREMQPEVPQAADCSLRENSPSEYSASQYANPSHPDAARDRVGMT